jgi:3-deoxy-D-manno-octulosonic-acid transferase
VPISKAPVSCASCIARPVYLLDSVGKLNYFYNIADIVFVGGSMVRKGGHNILEPAYFGKPVIFGPYMFNFRQISGLFLDNKAALLANNPEELKAGIRNMLLDERFSSDLGNKARAILLENSGASEANLKCIQAIFNG